jgi:hypothetical protein
MSATLKNNYFFDVTINIVKGFIVLGGLSAIFGVFLVGALFLFDGPINEYTKQQLEWCEQYHPTLSFSDCSGEAGW